MDAQLVNIPRNVDDVFYRYKMPALKTKVEGKGNGIKTVVENMSPIAQSLARPPAYMTKYFGMELGAQTICDEKADRWIVNGKHETEDLAVILDDFIGKYIICKTCKNPETVMVVKKDSITLVCSACSARSRVDMSHRLTMYIQKFPPSTKTQYDQQKKNQEKEEDSGMGTGENLNLDVKVSAAEGDDDWNADFSNKAVERRRRELLGGNDESVINKSEDLVIFLNQEGEVEDIDILKKIKREAVNSGWSESKIVSFVFKSLFTSIDLKTLRTKVHRLGLVVTNSKSQQIVLFLLEKMCEKDKTIIKQALIFLKVLYEEFLDSEIIIKWYNHPTKKIDPTVAKELREKAKPFIEWLEEEEDEEDDEDED